MTTGNGWWDFCLVVKLGSRVRHWHWPRRDIVNCDAATRMAEGE